MTKTKETHQRELNLQKSHLCKTFALPLVRTTRTEPINLQTSLIDTVVEVHQVIVIQIKK